MRTGKDKILYRITGIILVVAGLLANPWLIGFLLASKFTTTIFTGIFLFSCLLVFSGTGLVIKKQSFFDWVIEKYNDFAVIVLNVLLLILVINIFAALLIQKSADKKPAVTSYFTPQELYQDSINLLRKIYPGKSDKDISELLLLTSPYANHPVLEFQEKIQTSAFYNTGFEGVRFDDKVARTNVGAKINGSVWVFGGSTTFGHGVSDNETISAFLNKLDSARTYINFGVHAYHQSNEIEKLLLLLKKGYLPEKVIFIDGLNDVIRMIETNFHPLETPALAKDAYNSDYNIATKEKEQSLIEQMPVVRWLKSFIEEEATEEMGSELPWDKFDDVYDQDNLYNKDPGMHFRLTLLRSPYNTIDTIGLNNIVLKLKELYSSNYSFLEKISKAFGFQFSVYYQPIGIVSDDNPFWRNQELQKQSPLYLNFSYIIPIVRKQIADWNFPGFYDISDVQTECPDCYVDLTHYNPDLNKKIAEAILEIQESPFPSEK